MPSVLPCVNWKEPDISCAIRDAIKVGGLQIPSMSSMNSPSQICPSRIRIHQIRKTRIWYANVKNTGLFCVKDYCNHGHTGSYTLVTPQGKLYFAQLREMILLVS